MEKVWIIAQNITDELKNQFPEINPIILQLLHNRQIKTQREIDEFINPDYSKDLHDPFLFLEMEKAVERIFSAIANQEKILIYGDYDADGICASVVLMEFFKQVGIGVDIYLPDRENEGYGLNEEAIKLFSEKKINLIITVDCAINNNKEIALAKKLGIDTIITDHHCEPPELPKDAYAIINPKLKRENYPFRELAGVGVSFKLVQALTKKYESKTDKKSLTEGWEKWLLDLVAIGTVADLMPLLGENRTLVKYGLIVLNKTKRIGLKALLKKAGIDNKNLDTYNIGFQIGPRLNAAGRMDHANVSLNLLIIDSAAEAEEIAENLNQTNLERQKLIDKIIEEVNQNVDWIDPEAKTLFILGKDWPVGIIGLVASRLTDKWHKPSFVMTQKEETVVASGRSIAKVDIMKFLKELEDYFSHYGGHPKACGFTLKNIGLLDEFKKKFLELVERDLQDEVLIPELFIEKEIILEDVNWEFYEDLERFEPFGNNNNRPCFLIKNLQISNIENVGTNGNHLRIIVKDEKFNSKKMIGFGLGNGWGQKLKIGDKIDVVFDLSTNKWNGTKELQLKIIDLKLNAS